MPQPDGAVLVDLAADNVAARSLEIAEPVAVIDTTEPRLKAALSELIGGLS